jgi:ABC-type multidrug transport system ATPase subunit
MAPNANAIELLTMTNDDENQLNNDIERGDDPAATGATGTGTNAGFYLRWSRIRKEVTVVEATSGLLRGSIAVPNRESIETIKKTGPVKKTILNNVSGYARPGEIMALMGPSGSGKTSLLNVLSGRSAYESGDITVDGIKSEGAVMKRLKRKIAYVKQGDLFFGHLTVRDQLTYTALLRLPSHMSKTEKHAEVNRIISTLRLDKCANTPIMLLSGGEKKRVNIGTEMLMDPSVIMLDEPTSGLDSTSAVALMSTLHSLAKNDGKTIITSIHQPSSAVFQAFDSLMLLADGHAVYFGTPSQSLRYLDGLNLSCPSGYNAADHWMDLLVVDSAIGEGDAMTPFGVKNETQHTLQSTTHDTSAHDNDDGGAITINHGTMGGGGSNSRKKPRNILIAAWDGESIAKRVDETTKASTADNNNDDANADKDEFLDSFGQKYNATWLTQVRVLMHRSMKNSTTAIFTTLNLVKSAAIGLLMGLIWFRMPYTEGYVTDRVSYYFFTMTYWVFDAMFGALMAFPEERRIIFKERDSGCYHLSAYFIARTTSEAPARLSLPCLYLVISYWLANINPNAGVFFASILCTLLCVLSGESMGLLIGATVMDFQKAITLMTVVSLALMVVGGFFVANIPAFMSWVKYLSAFKYSFDASRQLVFDKPVPCDGSGVLEYCKGGSVGSVTPEQMRDWMGAQGSIGFNAGMLILLFLVPRYVAFLALKRQKGEDRF